MWAGLTRVGLPSFSAKEWFIAGIAFSACTMAKPIRCVKETLPPRARLRWLLMTMRLSNSSLTGIAADAGRRRQLQAGVHVLGDRGGRAAQRHELRTVRGGGLGLGLRRGLGDRGGRGARASPGRVRPRGRPERSGRPVRPGPGTGPAGRRRAGRPARPGRRWARPGPAWRRAVWAAAWSRSLLPACSRRRNPTRPGLPSSGPGGTAGRSHRRATRSRRIRLRVRRPPHGVRPRHSMCWGTVTTRRQPPSSASQGGGQRK